MQQIQKKPLIFYIHGWKSSGLALKAVALKKFFGETNVYAPTLPVNAKLAIHLLSQNIEQMKDFYDITLVGSSLGGYYSIFLSEKYNLKAVLVNPSIEPYITLAKDIGQHKNFDGSMYELTQELVDLYKEFEIAQIKNQKNFLVLLQKGDELLDYNQAAQKFKDSNLDIEEGGNHVYDGFDRKFTDIEKFAGFKQQ
ncbi:hypothetical protein PPERSA_04424 [Pseudocohnilembus persalinus]|uniref:Esterase n=1 Tax=Pseudocohnilembus persalinus TaxID=266149 RepID=A0A0V0QQY5_PSEPJ|nr:hypothetical protein PPERSA_04424 [Pseudocohnilembus persalinus]|eukprot:KRX04609.1 hypothetical protein PPERSA_04424 [Pseudocohnilembus persalinus]